MLLRAPLDVGLSFVEGGRSDLAEALVYLVGGAGDGVRSAVAGMVSTGARTFGCARRAGNLRAC